MLGPLVHYCLEVLVHIMDCTIIVRIKLFKNEVALIFFFFTPIIFKDKRSYKEHLLKSWVSDSNAISKAFGPIVKKSVIIPAVHKIKHLKIGFEKSSLLLYLL